MRVKGARFGAAVRAMINSHTCMKSSTDLCSVQGLGFTVRRGRGRGREGTPTTPSYFANARPEGGGRREEASGASCASRRRGTEGGGGGGGRGGGKRERERERERERVRGTPDLFAAVESCRGTTLSDSGSLTFYTLKVDGVALKPGESISGLVILMGSEIEH